MTDDRHRCCWVDTHGVRCPAGASVSRGTRGDGSGFCSAHANCSDARRGDRIVEQHVADGMTKSLSPKERRVLVRRMSQAGAVTVDIGSVLRHREAANQRRAVDVYEAEYRVAIQRGASTEEAHRRAVVRLYDVGRRDSLSMPAPRMVAADRRAGEVSVDES